jgi:hypothetical protein
MPLYSNQIPEDRDVFAGQSKIVIDRTTLAFAKRAQNNSIILESKQGTIHFRMEERIERG